MMHRFTSVSTFSRSSRKKEEEEKSESVSTTKRRPLLCCHRCRTRWSTHAFQLDLARTERMGFHSKRCGALAKNNDRQRTIKTRKKREKENTFTYWLIAERQQLCPQQQQQQQQSVVDDDEDFLIIPSLLVCVCAVCFDLLSTAAAADGWEIRNA